MTITMEKVTLHYGDKNIIDNLDWTVPEGKITVLIGGNGCGKSTLLRSAARLLKPSTGHVRLDGRPLETISSKQTAKRLAILPQSPDAPEGLTVMQLVKQGRYAHQTWLKQWSVEDEKAVQQALEYTSLKEFADRPVDQLSGGQRQRAWIAMTLAQQTNIILLDEPTTYLDMSHQIEILDLLFELNEKEGRTIVMVLHDLNLACRYAHHLVAVKDKTIYTEGAPEHIMDAALVKHVFGLDCRIEKDPIFGTPLCIPFGKGRHV